MDHHRCGNILEGAGLDQIHLASPCFLGGSSEDGDPYPQLVGESGEGDSGAEGGGGDDVMPTGVADFGEGVVFTTNDHSGSRRADGGFERGLQTVGRVGDGEPVVAEKRGKPEGGLVLGVRQLRVVVHPNRDLPELTLDGGEGLLGCALAVHGSRRVPRTRYPVPRAAGRPLA